MGCYRDDLDAAQLRIAELEAELEESRAALERSRDGGAPASRRRHLAIDMGGSVVLGLALAAMMVSIAFAFLWERKRDVSRQADQLTHELTEARAEAMAAKEEARVAMDMLAQGARSERPEGSDPLVATPREWGSSEARWSDGDDSTPQRRGSSVERGRGAAVIWATARPDADLTVDGVRYGRTPLMLRVEPGSHSLIYVHPTHGVRTRSLSVAADQTVRSDVVFASD